MHVYFLILLLGLSVFAVSPPVDLIEVVVEELPRPMIYPPPPPSFEVKAYVCSRVDDSQMVGYVFDGHTFRPMCNAHVGSGCKWVSCRFSYNGTIAGFGTNVWIGGRYVHSIDITGLNVPCMLAAREPRLSRLEVTNDLRLMVYVASPELSQRVRLVLEGPVRYDQTKSARYPMSSPCAVLRVDFGPLDLPRGVYRGRIELSPGGAYELYLVVGGTVTYTVTVTHTERVTTTVTHTERFTTTRTVTYTTTYRDVVTYTVTRTVRDTLTHTETVFYTTTRVETVTPPPVTITERHVETKYVTSPVGDVAIGVAVALALLALALSLIRRR